MIEYTVVEEFRQTQFVIEVNYKLKEGWKLQGGVSICCNPQTNTTYFAQAFIRGEEE